MTPSEFVPPMIDGVSASQVFLPALATPPSTLLDYLSQHFAHISRAEWQQRFADGLIYAANGEVLSTDCAYLAQQHIFYYRFLAHEITVPFQHHILFENAHLLVVDKPHFLTMSPTGQYVQQTLLVRLKQQTQLADLTPIHRLDRETAGVVMFSKQPASRGTYQQLFAERLVQKTYHAIAGYRADLVFPLQLNLRMGKGQPFYRMQVESGLANSQTHIELLAHNTQWGKYQLQPHSGKQHQLRLHLSHLGIGIQNDPLYPELAHKAEDDFTAPLQLLAKNLRFVDPISDTPMYFESRQELTLPES